MKEKDLSELKDGAVEVLPAKGKKVVDKKVDGEITGEQRFKDVLEEKKVKLKEGLKGILDAVGKDSGISLSTGFGVSSLIKDIPRIPFGILSLDFGTNGGVPQGRISEFYGLESSSKTTNALRIAGNAQKMGLLPSYIDAEGSLDEKWASKFVDLDHMLISKPESGEEAAEMVDVLVKSGTVDLIIVDSVAAMVPAKEIENAVEESTVGAHARLMNKSLRKWMTSMNYLYRTKKQLVTIILINQIRMKITMFGDPTTKTGGMGLLFAPSLVIKMWKGQPVFDKELENKPVMEDMNFKVTKSKVGPANISGIYTVMDRDTAYKKQGDIFQEEQIRKLALKYSVIEKEGKDYIIKAGGVEVGRCSRQEEVDEILLKNPKATKELYDYLLKFLIEL
jgi:recombination protein RecA